MKKERPVVYRKSFSRDFVLPLIEIWARVEGSARKFWTRESLPFSPFIVFHYTGTLAEGYYDERGIHWIKEKLLKESRLNKNFLIDLEKVVPEKMSHLRVMYERKTLSLSDLRNFLDLVEDYWPWFEIMWWLWVMIADEGREIKNSSELWKLRKSTQDFVPKTEAVVRSSLMRIFPELGEFSGFLLATEIQSGKIPDREELLRRSREYFFAENKLKTDTSISRLEQQYQIKLEKLGAELKVNKFRGKIAEKGIARGRVKIINGVRQINKVKNGDILVATMTMADFLPAMKKASAIITDEGSMMCHAAIIARELNKPCVVATRVATKVLKDGDLVEVDANRGMVSIINRKK